MRNKRGQMKTERRRKRLAGKLKSEVIVDSIVKPNGQMSKKFYECEGACLIVAARIGDFETMEHAFARG